MDRKLMGNVRQANNIAEIPSAGGLAGHVSLDVSGSGRDTVGVEVESIFAGD